MIRWIVRSSLRFRILVVPLAAALVFAGYARLRDTPVDILPEFTPPYVEIQTEALGLSADEVEQLITVPLEADLLNGVQGLDTIRSESVPGLSSIVLVFERGADLYRARQLVAERLTQAHALPNVSKPPTMLQPLSSSSRVLMIGLSSDGLSTLERSVIARWTIKPRLMGVPGVANVAIWGERDRQLQVQVDPEELRDRGVSLSQVVKTAGNAQIVSPLSFLEASTPGTGGFIETAQQRLQVRHVFDRLATTGELGKVPVEDASPRLRLTDVAEVVEGHPPLIGDAVVGDGDGLLLVVEKFPGANALEVTEGVEDALETLKPGLSGMEWDTSVFRPATIIEAAMDNVALALLLAAALLVLVLAACLFAWWTALIAMVSIPVSLLAAAIVLDLLGQTMNAIAFAGLAGALVLVVADAVAGVEAVARRVRERGRGSLASSILDASHDVRRPLGYAALITLLAVVPVVVMEGRPGAFFEPLALAFALAVLASMVVALTLTPALSLLLLLLRLGGDRTSRESPLVRVIAAGYATAVARAVRAPRPTLLAAGGVAVVGISALALLSFSPLPSFRDGEVLVRLEGAPGTSQPEMTRAVTQAGRDLRALPGVDNVGAHVGRALTGDQVVDVNSSELWVRLDRDADHQATVAAIDDRVGRLRGFDAEVATYTSQRMHDVGALARGENAAASGVDVLTGADEPLVVRLYGQDLDVLRRQADRVRQAIADVDGLKDPRVDVPATQPTLEIEVDMARARAHGIKPGDVRRAGATLLQGIQVGSIFERQKVFEVVVQGVPETRDSVAKVRDLLIDTPRGGHVRLAEVAEVRIAPAPTVIQREAVSRRVDVEAGVVGRGVEAVAADVEARLAAVTFPLEYHAEVLTPSTGEEAGVSRMVGFGVAAAIATLLLLQAAFGSWHLALVAFAGLPLALVGGVLAALAAGGEVSLGALVGFFVLLALAARFALTLVSHLQQLEREEGEAPAPALVVRGARECMTPILTTGVAVAAVMAPLAILGARPGLETVHPMAVVVLGGLVTTTLLALFVLPAAYLGAALRSRPSLVVDDVLAQPGFAGIPGVDDMPAPHAGFAGDPAGTAAGATLASERGRTGRLRWARSRFGGGLVATRRKHPTLEEDDDLMPSDPEGRG